MEQFLEIVTKPDNIPISAMALVVIFFTWLGLKQAFRSDQVIEEKGSNELWDEMIK
ncbi:MAG: hypothetical protein HYY20_13935 [Candidatus Tectomicrobia bacterium]|uniref:Uncharacterized protein n=1 Tax=Tectimicrobiota bacterium TaxID=2528274 RepID=A0A932CSU8_UNCTE|nr:hypothetical protein [Candidatus Tectomicrobia bacterium]